MKKCPNCGNEYGDDAVQCPIDGQPLKGDEVALPGGSPIIAGARAAPETATAWSDQQMRIFEVALVCLIAFGTAFVTSTYSFFHSDYGASGRSALSWAVQSIREVSALALVWYVLARRKESFSSLGLRWAWSDIGWSVILYFVGSLASYAVFNGIYFAHLTSTSREANHEHVGTILFGGGIFLSTVVFQLINPFFEELIARAYLMTEIKQLAKSALVAILASTILQTSYHLYQGVPATLSHGAAFLIFSIYYAKTNRIMPVILAHLYSDIGGTIYYWLRH